MVRQRHLDPPCLAGKVNQLRHCLTCLGASLTSRSPPVYRGTDSSGFGSADATSIRQSLASNCQIVWPAIIHSPHRQTDDVNLKALCG